jgi:hypothetical protein
MQKAATKLPFLHYNKVLPLLALHGKSNFESIYNTLLQHSFDNAYARVSSVLDIV